MTTATATEIQNNFGRFLKLVQEGQEIVISFILCEKNWTVIKSSKY